MRAAEQTVTRRLGRYEVVGRLALGGMAEILLARLRGPSGFDRPVVLKRILPHLRDAEFTRMLLEEGLLTARIRHPNVAQVQELCDDDDEVYLVIEYLEGEAAAGLARRLRARKMKLAPALVAYIGAEACAGLHAAHELLGPDGEPLQIVHRDVSPQNVFVGYDGTVKVLDFGIAKMAAAPARTEIGVLKGKLEYMAPEQAEARTIDRRCDLFSLGVVLYELAVQHHLFRRATPVETLVALREAPIPAPSSLSAELPTSLERVLMRALERDPARRYATALDMRRELLAVIRELTGDALPEQSLRELMQALFADRIAEKHAMLRELDAGAPVAHVPAADVDIDIELPTAFSVVKSEVRARPIEAVTVPVRKDGGGRVAAWAFLAAGLVAFGVIGWFWTHPFTRTPPPSATPAPPPGARAAADTPAPVPSEVQVSVETDSAGARVLVAGELLGTTPITFRLARSETSRVLRVEHDGYDAVDETIVPDVAQRLRITLDPVTATVAGPTGTAVGTRAHIRHRIDRDPPATAAVPPGATTTPSTTPPREFRRFH